MGKTYRKNKTEDRQAKRKFVKKVSRRSVKNELAQFKYK